MSFTQVFGGNTIYPSDVSYLALSLTEDVTLQWPLETAAGNNIVARIIDVTPTGAHSVFMPDATLTGVGQVTQFLNLGPYTITIKDFLGATLLSIDAGLTYTLYLTDNTAADGSWESFQAGAATAQAQAAQLAGYGLIAQGSLLSQSQAVTVFNTDFTLGAGNRSAAFVWAGGLGTLTLPTATSVGNNWFVSVRNGGEGNLTLPAQGSEKINGVAELVLRPGDSAIINTDGVDFYTVGFGQQAVFAFDYTSIDIAGTTGDYVLSGAELNRIAYSFVGEIVGDVVIVLPATTQQYWVANSTTGGSYTLGVAATGQMSPVDVPRDSRGIYYCEGTNVVKADTAGVSLPVAVADGGTGATSGGGALINLGGTTVGIDVFTAVDEAAARVAIGAGAGDGSVTSVDVAGGSTGLSFSGGPVTTSGTITAGGTLAVASGGTGQTSYTDGQLLIGNSSGGSLSKATLTEGSGITITNGNGTITVSAPGATGGSVTSVDVSGGSTGLTFSGGPITTSGTISMAGTLAVGYGGTGAATLPASAVLLGNGTSAVQSVAPGAAGYVLTSTGSAWASQPAAGASASATVYAVNNFDGGLQ